MKGSPHGSEVAALLSGAIIFASSPCENTGKVAVRRTPIFWFGCPAQEIAETMLVSPVAGREICRAKTRPDIFDSAWGAETGNKTSARVRFPMGRVRSAMETVQDNLLQTSTLQETQYWLVCKPT
uniref:Uncharacterized protein n=1 Tax=Noctiluca scintillans TaxID=2966 RepID=A0A7S1AQG8_NOCSC|mmetsp:Transcript_55867/g.149002  ORF Transcript_55867/g.149002 Transcript_55867/m.149002 type:complete len:125 (+) Transcript_55867:141-515(+)